MRKTKLILFFTLFAVAVLGQTATKTVKVNTAGTLSTLLTDTEANTVTNLIVTGNIDARDVVFMRDKMVLLADLDLSAVKISAYTGIDGTYTTTSITYPANEMPLCSFYNSTTITYKSTLNKIKLPISIKSIGGSAFYYCYGLSGTLTIPASVTSIGSYAFYGCSLISAYQVETANTRYSSSNGVVFNKQQDSLFICPAAKVGSYVIPQTIVSIGASAFEGCSNLTGSLTIPSSVKSIGNYAFYYCSGLTGIVTIPKSVTYIGSFSFFECNKLTSYQVDPANSYYSSGNDILFNKLQDILFICPIAKSGSYTIPGTVITIGSYAFYNCSSLTGSLVIPKSVSLIGVYAFYGCTFLSAYEVDPQNARYLSTDGVLFNKNQDSLFVCPAGKTGSYSIPNSVKVIGTYSFFYCTGLNGIIFIPSSVKTIGNYAFYGCNKLTAFVVDQTNKVYSSNEGVLFNKNQDSLFICPVGKLGKYQIPNTVVAIDYSAFEGCTGLTGIGIPNSVTSIGSYAFSYCTGLTEITLPPNIATIGSGAFYYSGNLQKISIENAIPPAIDSYTFAFIDKSSCQLFVPIESKITYQTSANWKDFSIISESNFIITVVPERLNDEVKIYTNHQNLIVEGLKAGESIEVYTLNGMLIYSSKSSGNTIFINVKNNEIYLIKTKEKTVKLFL
jgi:hypothetical protein